MKNEVAILEEDEIYKQLANPKVNSRVARMNDYAFETKQKILVYPNKEEEKFYSRTRAQAQRLEFIKESMNNPSLGTDFLRRTFRDYFSHFNIQPYDNKFRKNYKQKHLGSLLLATRIRKEEDYHKYEKVENNKFTKNSKQKMKWKTINWILENKKDVIGRLMEFFDTDMKSNTKATEKVMSLKDFGDAMRINGITNDSDLINKLFWVFDEDGDRTLKFKEIAFGIEMFSESSIDKKLKAFFNMCDEDNSGSISKQEFLNLLKKNIINNDHKNGIKHVVDRIFSSVELDKNGEITYDKLKEGFEKNKELQDIIYSNSGALRVINNLIDNDIKKKLISFNPDLNDELRMKILGTKISCLPLREEKFTKLLTNFIDNKNKLKENNKFRDEDDELYYDHSLEQDEILFSGEKEFVRNFI